MVEKTVQTRSEETGIKHFKKFEDALAAAKADESIWKISFNTSSGERVRLVRNDDNKFEVQQMMEVLQDYME